VAVHKRGYRRYQGPLTSRWARLMVLPRFGWERLTQQRVIVVLFVISMFWPVACGIFVYLSNQTALQQQFAIELPAFLKVDNQFFLLFMTSQSVLAMILSALAGPSLIAPDLGNGALPLYFSRALSRWEYVVARLLVLAGLLSPVTWIPGVLLFFMQSSMAGWYWFSENWHIGAGVFLGFLLWNLLVSLVALACSAYVKWRVVAGALVLGVFFVLAGATRLTNMVLRVEWASAFNPAKAFLQIWHSLLGLPPEPGPGALECFITIGLMTALLVAVLRRKLRPVEVVS